MFLDINYLLALVLVLTLHEFAHAWTADRLGDITPEREGRLSLNPMRHLDLLGTLMLFLAGIGWGKPVPINPRNFKSPARDEAFTALAGPLMNLAIAFVAAIILNYSPALVSADGAILGNFLSAVFDLSLVLFIFNFLPFAPLDGSKFLILLVPLRYRAQYQFFLSKSTPYFLLFAVVDLYFFKNVFGFSLIWSTVSTLFFWLKTAILVVV